MELGSRRVKVSRKLEEEEDSGRHEGTDDQIKVRSFIVTWSVAPIVGRLILVEFLSKFGRILFSCNKLFADLRNSVRLRKSTLSMLPYGY